MSLSWFCTVIDCHDPEALAEFWRQALGYQVVYRDGEQVGIAADSSAFPGLLFLRMTGPKKGKNRLHIDLNPSDQQQEVQRLAALGATRIDIGQGAGAGWMVMADPEGNEFCVLAPQTGW